MTVKKLLCIALTLILTAMITIAAVPASAQIAPTGTGVLVVTVNGSNPVEVAVGNEFILNVGLNAGSSKILNGQVHMEYDENRLAFDPHEAYSDAFEDELVEGYCFPNSINNANIVMNYEVPGIINYNFTKAKGVAIFNDTSKHFSRFRFKATAAGTADIVYLIQYMTNVDEQVLYYKSTPSETLNPYTAITVEPSNGHIGDADGDYDVTILDATFMQRAVAGVNLTYSLTTADVTNDSRVSLKDAVTVRKFLAGKPVNSSIGEWIFASEAG